MMSNLTLERFRSAAQRFADAEAAVLPNWQGACECPAPGERQECNHCPYYKLLGRLTQKHLNRESQEDFPTILMDAFDGSDLTETKKFCQDLFLQGYSIADIQEVTGLPRNRQLRGWLREVGLPERSASHPPEVKRRCLELYAERCTPKQIEDTTGVPADTIVDWAYEAGISRKRKYPNELKQQCLDSYKAGKSTDEIHVDTGIPTVTIRQWVSKARIVRPQKRYSDEEKKSCLDLYRAGKKAKEISEITGIKRGTIQSWIRQEGLNESEFTEGDQTPLNLEKLIEAAKPQRKLRRPSGYWQDFDTLARELRQFNVERGQPKMMPKATELREAGRGDLLKAITKHHGDFQTVAERMGLEFHTKRHRYWYDWENLKKELLEYIEQQGTPGVMPTKEKLEQADRKALAYAIVKMHEGFPAVAKKLDLKLSYGRKPRGYWKDPENLRREIEEAAEQLGIPGTLPTVEQLQGIDRTDILSAIAKNGGWPSVAKRFGFIYEREYQNPNDYF